MFEELLADLDRANVRFVVVGGLAVVIQGYARLTADVDLVIDLDAANVRRAVDTLVARGLRPLLPVNAADVFVMPLVAWQQISARIYATN